MEKLRSSDSERVRAEAGAPSTVTTGEAASSGQHQVPLDVRPTAAGAPAAASPPKSANVPTGSVMCEKLVLAGAAPPMVRLVAICSKLIAAGVRSEQLLEIIDVLMEALIASAAQVPTDPLILSTDAFRTL